MQATVLASQVSDSRILAGADTEVLNRAPLIKDLITNTKGTGHRTSPRLSLGCQVESICFLKDNIVFVFFTSLFVSLFSFILF